jgi:hypothetical protein
MAMMMMMVTPQKNRRKKIAECSSRLQHNDYNEPNNLTQPFPNQPNQPILQKKGATK